MGTALCFRFLRFPKALKHSGRKCSEQMTVCCLGWKLPRPMFSTHSFSSSGRLNGNLRAEEAAGGNERAFSHHHRVSRQLGKSSHRAVTPHPVSGSFCHTVYSFLWKRETMNVAKMLFPKLRVPGEPSPVPRGARHVRGLLGAAGSSQRSRTEQTVTQT